MFEIGDYVVVKSYVHPDINGKVGRVKSRWNYGGVGKEHWVFVVGVLEYPEMSYRSHQGLLKSPRKGQVLVGHIKAYWKRNWVKKRLNNLMKCS